MVTKFSCYGCDKRSPGCHGSCETYKREKHEYDERKEQIAKDKAIRDGIYRQRTKAVTRAERKKLGFRNRGRKEW